MRNIFLVHSPLTNIETFLRNLRQSRFSGGESGLESPLQENCLWRLQLPKKPKSPTDAFLSPKIIVWWRTFPINVKSTLWPKNDEALPLQIGFLPCYTTSRLQPETNYTLVLPSDGRPTKKRTELRQKRLLSGMWESLLCVGGSNISCNPHCASSLFWVSECATTLTLGLGLWAPPVNGRPKRPDGFGAVRRRRKKEEKGRTTAYLYRFFKHKGKREGGYFCKGKVKKRLLLLLLLYLISPASV